MRQMIQPYQPSPPQPVKSMSPEEIMKLQHYMANAGMPKTIDKPETPYREQPQMPPTAPNMPNMHNPYNVPSQDFELKQAIASLLGRQDQRVMG